MLSARIDVCDVTHRVDREMPDILEPYMTRSEWETFCNDLEEAMQPWLSLAWRSARYVQIVGLTFLLFVITFLTFKFTKYSNQITDMTAIVIFPILMLSVAGFACWLLTVIPSTDESVKSQIHHVLEEATFQCNINSKSKSKPQPELLSLQYIEEEKRRKRRKSTKFIQVSMIASAVPPSGDHHHDTRLL